MAPSLRGDDLPLNARQQPLRFGQGQTQVGDIDKIIRPSDLHDVRARPLALSPDLHQPQHPSHASTLSQRTNAKITNWPLHPQTCDSPADRLAQQAPASQALLARAAERGASLSAVTAALLRLLDRASAADLQAAILEALERDVPHPNAVRLALERRREQHGDAPPIALVLPAHVQARDAPVRPHALEPYDQLKEHSDD